MPERNRPPRDRQVCGDCGRDLDPVEAQEVRLANTVMQVCPACFDVREELDALLS